MVVELRLPDVGEGVAEGEIVRWLVSEGQQVREDELLVEVMTDKANVEIPSPVAGTIARIVAEPGQVVPVGAVLALIDTTARGNWADGELPQGGEAKAPDWPAAGAEERAGRTAGEVLAAPSARKLAKDLGVDLSGVRGTGPGGRVMEEDVRRAAAAGPSALEERIPFRGRLRMAAKKVALAKSTVPHALLVDEADATELLAMRDLLREVGAREGVKITYLPFIVQAVVTALRIHPAMNASLDEAKAEIVRWKRYDIGIAVDSDEGLAVPVIRDAGEKTLLEIAREIERLAEAARGGSLSPRDVGGSTFTVTSVGSIGGLFSYPVINVPEAGILGVHKIIRRPVVREGEVVARDMMYLSLSFDHRIVDGGTATRFLNDVIRQIEAPVQP